MFRPLMPADRRRRRACSTCVTRTGGFARHQTSARRRPTAHGGEGQRVTPSKLGQYFVCIYPCDSLARGRPAWRRLLWCVSRAAAGGRSHGAVTRLVILSQQKAPPAAAQAWLQDGKQDVPSQPSPAVRCHDAERKREHAARMETRTHTGDTCVSCVWSCVTAFL